MPDFKCSECGWKGPKLHKYTDGNYACPKCAHSFEQECFHPNLVIHTQIAGKKVWKDEDNKLKSIIDWDSNIIGAHYLRVMTYYCPACNKLIDAPKEVPNVQTG